MYKGIDDLLLEGSSESLEMPNPKSSKMGGGIPQKPSTSKIAGGLESSDEFDDWGISKKPAYKKFDQPKVETKPPVTKKKEDDWDIPSPTKKKHTPLGLGQKFQSAAYD